MGDFHGGLGWVQRLARKRSFGGRLSDLLLPELFGLPVILEHFLLLAGIIQLDLAGAFTHPVEEELSRRSVNRVGVLTAGR